MNLTKPPMCLLVLMVIHGMATPSNASIIVTFDTTAETYQFDGSATITPDFFAGGMFGPDTWSARYESEFDTGGGLLTGSTLGMSGLNFSAGGNVNSPPVVLRFSEIGNDPTQISSVFFRASFTAFSNPGGDIVLAGDGQAYSYAGLTSFEKAFLAAANLPDATLASGSSSDGISFDSFASVPEPSSFAVLGLSVAILGFRRRRNCYSS